MTVVIAANCPRPYLRLNNSVVQELLEPLSPFNPDLCLFHLCASAALRESFFIFSWMSPIKQKKRMEKDEIIRALRSFIALNRDRYEIIRLGVFGSAARDDMNEQSDIDVVVELGKPDLFYLVGIKQDLEEKFRRPVDIVRYRDTMNGFLKKRIDKEAVYV